MAISALPALNSTTWYQWASDMDAAARTAVQTPQTAGSAGQSLVLNSSGQIVWGAPAASSATSSALGSIQLAGDLTGSATAPALVTTGVSAGSYGSTYQVPVLTLDAKGRVTSASVVQPVQLQSYYTGGSGSTANQWTRIATLSVGSQYSDAQIVAVLQASGDGNATGSVATLRLRVKQQAAMGSAPIVESAISSTTGSILPSNVLGITTSNTASLTQVDFYVQIVDTYRQYAIGLLSSSLNSGSFQLYSAQGMVATGSLPSGTQTAGKYDPAIAESQVLNLTSDLAAKASLVSPTFSGTVLAPTPAANTNNTQIATTAFVEFGDLVISNLQTGTSYTLVATDNGVAIDASNASAFTLTVPTNATIPFAVGTVIEVCQYGAGQVTVAAASGVTIQRPNGTGNTTRVQYSTIALRKRNTDEWILSGDLT